MLEAILFRTIVMPILFWTVLGGLVALGLKVVMRRQTMALWPILPFALWGVVRALVRAWQVLS